MTPLSTDFENNAKAAHAVYSFLDEIGFQTPQLTIRPFNRFDTAFTEWWMIPSSDWPAYRYGKLCFWRYPNSSDGKMYVGYYVEKGLHPAVAGMPDVDSKQIMREDWYWPEFIGEVKSVQFIQAAHQVAQAAGTYPSILIHAHEFNKAPREDQPRGEPNDVVEFRLGPTGNGIEVLRSAESVLATLNTCASLNLAIEALSQLDLRFHWIDLIVGIPFQYGTKLTESWTAAKLWQDALLPWIPWVR